MKKAEKAIREYALELLKESKNGFEYWDYMREYYAEYCTQERIEQNEAGWAAFIGANESVQDEMFVYNFEEEINEKICKLVEYVGHRTVNAFAISKNIRTVEGVKNTVKAWDRIEEERQLEPSSIYYKGVAI